MEVVENVHMIFVSLILIIVYEKIIEGIVFVPSFVHTYKHTRTHTTHTHTFGITRFNIQLVQL